MEHRAVKDATLNRPGLETAADRLRSYARRWRTLASRRGETHGPRLLVALTFEDAAEILEAGQFKLELGGSSGPRAKKKKPAKAPRVTRRERVLALLATGPLSVNDVALALGLRSRNAYEEVLELYRSGRVARREVPSEGRRHAYYLYYMPEGRRS